ncbi:autophagy protein Apg9-domain-containing protein [Obelidium mucronatum]|nr:autophagy protein Apg9-domain-containing protein [Obelidium mucronatum]
MVGFSTFAFSCIDHSRIHKHKQLSDVIIPQCIKTLPGIQSFFLIIFGIWWLSQVFRLFLDLPHLYEIKLVYEHILEIKESDMDTVEWQEIVQKLSHLKYTHPNLNPERKPGLDSLNAHSIVNRIMRKDNYLIAMFNKEILNLRVPGVLGGWLFGKKGIVVTKILEWNLYFCVVLYAFDEKGALRRRFLKSNHRRRLVIGLQQRFELMGILNLLFSPFLLVIAILYSLFKYAEEYQKSPASLGARQYTLQAQWTLREFNELPHTFQTRLNRSYPLAVKYLDQFRKQKTILLARLISFIAGAFVAALAMLAILDQELTEFEITPGRSALFYITVFGGILAAVRGTIPDETRIFEPESHLKQVIEETHHLPESWRGKLHTEFVKNEFSALFDLKMKQLLLEVASLVLAPFILYYSMPHSAEAIIDFIRDCTVDMEGVGFVCSFAAFDLARYGNPKYGVPTLAMGEGKMEQSFLYFKANYPQWDVGVDGSQYLQALSRSTQRLAGANGLRSEASILLEGGAAGTGTLVPNQSSSNGGVRMLTESRLGLSEMERSGMDEEPVGLFGILDAVYEANNRARL